MNLYYTPGACSLADHIALLEADMKFNLVKVDLKTHQIDDGRALGEINRKNYVPVLEFDDGQVLTENIAILSFIADSHPSLLPPGALGRYRHLETLAFIATEIHKAFKPFFSANSSDEEKHRAARMIEGRLEIIEAQLNGHPCLFGRDATAADAYLFVMLMWAEKNNISIPDKLKVFSTRMRTRPTVHAALMTEGLVRP
jgi:glutathione S-transferase